MATSKIEIIPAVLEKTAIGLLKKLDQLKGISRLVQIDFADGRFVQNKTPLPDQIKTLPGDFKYIFHLMTDEPEKFEADLERLGAETIIFHLEAVLDPSQTIKTLAKIGKVGAAYL